MQVDRTNIQEALPGILQRIKQADFVAFDCEFTGLVTKLDRIEGLFPNHVQFYQRIKETALNFKIIQLGIAAFVYQGDRYHPHVFNIYVCPDTFVAGYNNVMVCEVESLEFLARNNLDFTRVFTQGIRSRRLYANDPVQKHQYNQFPAPSHENMFLSPNEAALAASIEQGVLRELADNWRLEKGVDFGTKALFNYFRLKYPNLLLDKGKKNMKQFEYVIRWRQGEKPYNRGHQPENIEEIKKQEDIMVEDKIKPEPKQQQPDHNEYDQALGLSKIFEVLIQYKKPLVGHFPNLDIGLIFQSFIGDLPATYQQFCHQLQHLFPYLYDTKVISRRIQSRLKGIKVDLPSLFKACQNPKLLKPYFNLNITGYESYIEREHEAGYDAFITGCSFLGMANYLAGKQDRVAFQAIHNENLLLYSRFSGEVSLSGNGYSSNSVHYPDCIVIQPLPKSQNPLWVQTACKLSAFGTLTVHEDRGETYYVYEEPRDIIEIIKMLPELELKPYAERKIIYARNMYEKGH